MILVMTMIITIRTYFFFEVVIIGNFTKSIFNQYFYYHQLPELWQKKEINYAR